MPVFESQLYPFLVRVIWGKFTCSGLVFLCVSWGYNVAVRIRDTLECTGQVEAVPLIELGVHACVRRILNESKY